MNSLDLLRGQLPWILVLAQEGRQLLVQANKRSMCARTHTPSTSMLFLAMSATSQQRLATRVQQNRWHHDSYRKHERRTGGTYTLTVFGFKSPASTLSSSWDDLAGRSGGRYEPLNALTNVFRRPNHALPDIVPAAVRLGHLKAS